MSVIAVLGCLWGDEAKAKIVDYLGAEADIVVRFQGGANAGHTICLGEQKYVFHSIPSGILYPESYCVIGAGVMIDPVSLKSEIESLIQAGIDLDDRIYIDERCGIVLPIHKELDAQRESDARLSKIGTTKRGIGPAYADRSARIGLRFIDLKHPQWLKERLVNIHSFHGTKKSDAQIEAEAKNLEEYWNYFASMVKPTDKLLMDWYNMGKNILFEGAQGTLLDLNFGTYPYVTSSHTILSGISIGTAFPLRKIDNVIGVFKAYSTRVGDGAFPTELFDDTGNQIRIRGNEFGSTTGRPRRIGWFDAVAGRYSTRINDLDTLAVTLLDVLSGLEEIKICTGYWLGEARMEEFPADPIVLQQVKPEYLSLKGWDADITACKKINKLPKAAIEYLEAIQDLLETRISIVSVGKERSQTIVIK